MDYLMKVRTMHVSTSSQPTQHDDILYCRNSQPENYVYYVLPLVVEGIPLPTPYFNFQTIKQNTVQSFQSTDGNSAIH